MTSIRAPGKRSSASTSVPTPASLVSGPTNIPPLRLFLMLLGLPAPRAVLDRGGAARSGSLAKVVARGKRGHAHRLFDARPLDPRLGAPRLLRGFGMLGVLLALALAAQAARGVKISSGGSGSTHGVLIPLWC